MTDLIVFLAAYVIGATPFGYFAGKLKGIDIREHGSGNIGATNVLRTLGKGVGIPVFILDVLKGAVPVLLAQILFSESDITAVLAALGTILGHTFTFWLGFKGGKGVATSGGAILALVPLALLGGLVAWLAVFYSTRYVALASIVAAVAIPVVVAIQTLIWKSVGYPLLVFSIVVGALVVWRHRSNITRLMDGTEHKFTRRKKD